jgi:hypothetical protein
LDFLPSPSKVKGKKTISFCSSLSIFEISSDLFFFLSFQSPVIELEVIGSGEILIAGLQNGTFLQFGLDGGGSLAIVATLASFNGDTRAGWNLEVFSAMASCDADNDGDHDCTKNQPPTDRPTNQQINKNLFPFSSRTLALALYISQSLSRVSFSS